MKLEGVKGAYTQKFQIASFSQKGMRICKLLSAFKMNNQFIIS